MIIRKAVAIAAAALIASSGPAHANAAQSLSLSHSPVVERASAQVEGENRLFGEGALITLAMVAIAALVIWQGYELITGNDDEPLSP